MGRGPAWPIKFRKDGPRPGPADQNFRGWAAAQPSPSYFQFFMARPINFSEVSVRPGPARHNFQIGLARPGPDKRHMTNPVFCLSPHIWVLYFLVYLGLEGSYISSKKKTNVNGAAGAHKGAAPARDISRTKTC